MLKLVVLALLPVVFGVEPETRGIFDSISDRLRPESSVVYIKKVEDKPEQKEYKKEYKKDNKDDYCWKRNGVSVQGYCLEYIRIPVSYNAAVTHCMSKGGSLWVPDLFDPDLYKKYFKLFPQLFSAISQDIFIGLQRSGNRYIGSNGIDYTNSPYVRAGLLMNRNCFILNFEFGAFYISGNPDCAIFPGDYICQYHNYNYHT